MRIIKNVFAAAFVLAAAFAAAPTAFADAPVPLDGEVDPDVCCKICDGEEAPACRHEILSASRCKAAAGTPVDMTFCASAQ